MSASQINVWDECQRKWAFKYIAKLRPEAHKSAALGVKVHSQLERYLKTGDMPDFVADSEAGNIAASGLHHLPTHETPGLEVEQHFKFQSPATGIWYRGFIDALVAPSPYGDRAVDGRLRSHGAPLVLDHKTTSDINWAKTPQDLLTDTQAILYAQYALIRWPAAPAVDLQWTYFQTRKTRKSLPVLQTVSREHVSHTFPLIDRGGLEIVTTLSRKPAPLDLPPNPRACGMFGGCPFTAQCNLSPEETIRAMSNADQKTTSLLARLGNPAPAPAAPPAGGLLAGLLGKKVETPAEDAPKSAEEVPAPTGLPAWMTAAKDPGPGKLPATDQPINPPEHQPAPATLGEAEQVLSGGNTTDPTPAPEAPKGKRGRPAGSKNKPKDEAPAADVSPTTVVNNVTVVQAAEPAAEGFTLYVDCFPVGRRATMLEKLVARAQASITEQTGKADYRMIDYGQGAGLLSGLVASYVGDEDVVLDSRTPEGIACKAALMSKAAVVVMGLGR